jgi:hypothetical protein
MLSYYTFSRMGYKYEGWWNENEKYSKIVNTVTCPDGRLINQPFSSKVFPNFVDLENLAKSWTKN